jgi:succinate dehydrogenase / fumarate reductase flavoprotein subunit
MDPSEVGTIIADAMAPFDREAGENPYEVQNDLQDTMHRLVGIIRIESELIDALDSLEKLQERVAKISVSGGQIYNPGWNLATDLPAMLAVSNLVARGALERRESRGGHTRDDYPAPDPELGRVNLVQRLTDEGHYTCTPAPLAKMPDDLAILLEEATPDG